MPRNYAADFAFVDAQLDALEKTAISVANIGRLVGGTLGAGGGAATGYATAPPEQRTAGAIKGALIGGVGGLAIGQSATAMGRRQVQQFGQRQLHGATGYLPGRGILGNKGGPMTGEQRVKALQDIGWTLPKKKVETVAKGSLTPTKGAVTQAIEDKGPGGIITKHFRGGKIDKFLTKQRLRSDAAKQQLAEEGLTSLPGVIKGYATGGNLGRAGVLKANLLAPGVVAGTTLPAAFAAPGIVQGVQERDPRIAAKAVADSASYSLFGGLPLLTGMAAATGLSAGAGRLIGTRQPQAQPQVPVNPAQVGR